MSGANIITNSISQLYDAVNRIFLPKAQWDQLINVMVNSWIVSKESVPLNTWKYRIFAENVVKNSYAVFTAEGAPAPSTMPQYGYEKAMEIKQYEHSISITKMARLTWKDSEIIRQLTDLSENTYRKIDLDLSHRLSFWFATSYVDNGWQTVDLTSWDWLATFSASHTLTGSSSTWSNIVPNNPQFSKGAYTAAKRLWVENTFNNLWEKMAIDFDLVITTDDEDTVIAVKELSNATADTNSSNAWTFNVYRGLKHIIAPRIATTATGWVDTTKRKYWFLGSSSQKPIKYAELEAPYVKTPRDWNNGEDAMTENWNFLTATRYWIVICSPRGLIASKWDWTA
jgi:hypothetical protein